MKVKMDLILEVPDNFDEQQVREDIENAVMNRTAFDIVDIDNYVDCLIEYFVWGCIKSDDGNVERVPDDMAKFWGAYRSNGDGTDEWVADFLYKNDADEFVEIHNSKCV